jgi:tRNA1(Val) A37 N6-methylase TrmN6
VSDEISLTLEAGLTQDAFLGGRLRVVQPGKGHRAGIEAVLIAAAAPVLPGQSVLDIGAGVGVAGLCALIRVAGARALLVEAEPDLAELARRNAARNGLADQVTVVTADVTARGVIDRLGLTAGFDHALANPPFFDPARSRSSPVKAPAHVARPGALDDWVRFAAAALRPGGSLTLVHRAEALDLVLAAFGRRFGGVSILPLHPRPGRAASRIIVQGVKGSRAPLSIRPGLVLHGTDGHGFRPAVDAVLRDGASLE